MNRRFFLRLLGLAPVAATAAVAAPALKQPPVGRPPKTEILNFIADLGAEIDAARGDVATFGEPVPANRNGSSCHDYVVIVRAGNYSSPTLKRPA